MRVKEPARLDQVYSYVRSYIDRYRYAPTYREIMNACQFASTSRVKHYLHRLHEAGRINFTPGVSRGIVLREEYRERS